MSHSAMSSPLMAWTIGPARPKSVQQAFEPRGQLRVARILSDGEMLDPGVEHRGRPSASCCRRPRPSRPRRCRWRRAPAASPRGCAACRRIAAAAPRCRAECAARWCRCWRWWRRAFPILTPAGQPGAARRHTWRSLRIGETSRCGPRDWKRASRGRARARGRWPSAPPPAGRQAHCWPRRCAAWLGYWAVARTPFRPTPRPRRNGRRRNGRMR